LPLSERGLARRAAGDDLALLTNIELSGPPQQDSASNVGEPSASLNGQVFFYTGNWYAANSIDGGATIRYHGSIPVFAELDIALCVSGTLDKNPCLSHPPPCY